ncbi:MAG: cell division protein ZapE [Thiolinea sp.]
MSLKQQYYDKIDRNVINPDPFQEKAVGLLEDAATRLQSMPESRPEKSSAGRGFFSFFSRSVPETATEIPKGVYLWGGVGRGKTWLMDMFYESVPVKDKKRYHFHHIMELLHKAIKQHPDQEDPLRLIARDWAKSMRLLCLDELHLTEIANASLLLPLLEYLMREGVLLVTTSNRHPSELYQGNLKKELFVPYTDFLQQHMNILHLDSPRDYRTLGLDELEEGHELETLDEAMLEARFNRLSKGEVKHNQVFTINHREVPIQRVSDNIIWLDFAVACEGTRTTSDYIWMADRYKIVMLSNVSVMTTEHESAARRFFNLIDEVYDRDVRLLFSSEVPIKELYQGYRLQFAFRRTLSRLTAMYLANRDTD